MSDTREMYSAVCAGTQTNDGDALLIIEHGRTQAWFRAVYRSPSIGPS